MKRVIKRYQNRKLYDTRTHKYITFKEIVDFVKYNEEFEVIDNKDFKVITNNVLLNVFAEYGKMDLIKVKELINTYV